MVFTNFQCVLDYGLPLSVLAGICLALYFLQRFLSKTYEEFDKEEQEQNDYRQH